MKSLGIRSFFISLFLIIVSFLNVANSSFVVDGEAKQENITINEGSKAVCYNSRTGTKYTTIEKALAVAKQDTTNNDTIYVIPGTNPIITQSCEIASGDTLCLPYEGTTWDYGTTDTNLSDNFIDSNSTNVNKYRVNKVTLQNSTLTIKSGGTLNIGGKFRAKGVCGLYCELALDANSHIEVYGSMTNYGYIKEIDGKNPYQDEFADIENKFNNEIDSNRYIEVFSGGIFKNSLAVYNNLGASYLSGLNDIGICPVDTFDFPNTQTYLKINYGAIFQAQVRILVVSSAANKAVNETTTIISNKATASADKSQPLFFLESGYMSVENCPTNALYSNAQSRTVINISGQLNMGYLFIDLSVAEINTSTMYLPISYKLSINIIKNGNFTSDYKLKFLAGSKIKIDKGSSARLNSDTILYKSSTMNDFSTTYPTDKDDAIFINNGELILGSSSHFGGHISTNSSDGTAKIDATNITSGNLSATSNEGTSNTPITFKATGDFYIESSSSIEKKQLASGQIIYSSSDGHACWANGYVNSYSLVIKVVNPNNYTYPAAAFKAYQYDSAGANESLLSSEGKFEVLIGTYEYLLQPNYKFKVVSLPRAQSSAFTSQSGTNYTFISGQLYTIQSDIELTITCGEGYEMWFTSSGQSGNSGSTKTIMECSTQNGTFETLLVGGAGGGEERIIIGKNQYFKYTYKKGTGTASFKGIYRFDGHHSDTTSTTNGTLVGASTSSTTSNAVLADKEYTLLAYMEANGGCFEKGTLVTTNRGLIAVENLKSSDLIESYNHETGTYEYKPIAALIDHGENKYKVINLDFSDGSNIGFITCHGLFDLDENKYVDINENNYLNYIGHRFAKGLGSEYEEIVLVNASIIEKITNSYTVLSSENINCEANGILNITSVLVGIYNIFDYDNNHNFDITLMKQDIEKYGLYTYDDFKDRIDEKKFYDLGFKYFKVAIGKGLLTDNILQFYIDWFYECIRNGEAIIY